MNIYFEKLNKIILGQYKDEKEESDRVSDNNDKLIVWIVGISTGSIALILSAKNNIDLLPQESLRSIIFFFVVTIILGVVGRALSAISSLIGFKLNSIFFYNLKTSEIPHAVRNLTGEENAETIYFYLISDFQADPQLIQDYMKNLNVKDRKQYDMIMRDFYSGFAKSREEAFDLANNTMRNIIIDSFGYRKNHFDKQPKISNRIPGWIMRRCTTIHLYFYGVSVISFTIAATLLSIKAWGSL